MLARRLASTGLRLTPSLVSRSCVTYVPSKKPFVYYVEKDGEQVPLNIQDPVDAPKWYDNNEDFWRKADVFVADHPGVSPPYRQMKWIFGLLTGGGLFYVIFLQDESAGRAWCDGWTNQDKFLMFGMEPGEHLTKEDRAIIAKRREVARTLPLLTRLAEIQRRHPWDLDRSSYRFLRDQSRLTMGVLEAKMRKPTPEQKFDNRGSMGYTLIHQLEASRADLKPDEVVQLSPRT